MLAQVMERQANYFEAFLREELGHLVERVLERVADQVAACLMERLTASLIERSIRDAAGASDAIVRGY